MYSVRCCSLEPMAGIFIWVDVRDVALAHVNAMEREDAGGKRFFATAGTFTNRAIVDSIRKDFPEYSSGLPPESWKGGQLPEGGIFDIDNARATDLIGGKWRSLDECIVDTVRSFKAVGA